MSEPTKCDTCGAEWEMGTRSVGETCGAAQGHKPPFRQCGGKLIHLDPQKRQGPCPKCKATSGNDWTQCDGDCPMPMSPHYKPR